MYSPDHWLVLDFTHHKQNYRMKRVFATWDNSLFTCTSWQMNSGIVRAELVDDYYFFYGRSGSVYRCHKDGYGTTKYGEEILDWFDKQPDMEHTILPETTDFTNKELYEDSTNIYP